MTLDVTEKLCKQTIDNLFLTNEELNEYGINLTEIENLIKRGILIQNSESKYQFVGVEELYQYGKKKLATKEYDQAYACFKKIYVIDPTLTKNCFQLFINTVRTHKYEDAIKYFDTIYNANYDSFVYDNNFYLYLFSMLIELPDKYKKLAKEVRLADILPPSDGCGRYNDFDLQSKIRQLSYNHCFNKAQKEFREYVNSRKCWAAPNVLIAILLSENIAVQKIDNNTINKLIKNKDYDKIVSFIEHKMEYCSVNKTMTVVLSLSKSMQEILLTKKIPVIEPSKTTDMFVAITNNDFKLALELSNEYIEKKGHVKERDAINGLLQNINEAIESIKNDPTIETKSTNNSLFEIFNSLLNGNIDGSIELVNTYLEGLGKKEYQFLITDLIKLSLLNHDLGFTKPLAVLTYIGRENFNLDLNEYNMYLYKALTENKLEETKLYLDIIKNANNIGISSTLLEIESKKSSEVVEESISSEPIVVKKAQKPDITSLERDYINELYMKLVTEHGVIIIGNKSKDKIARLQELIKMAPGIGSFIIGNEDNPELVIKKEVVGDKAPHLGTVITEATNAFNTDCYDKAIKLYMTVVENVDIPKDFVYAKLGLLYLKKKNIDTAITCLNIATKLSQNDSKKYDFTEFIRKIKAKKEGIEEVEEVKPFIEIDHQEFVEDINNYYGITNIEEITTLMVENNLSINQVCTQLGLDEEKKNLVGLILARECFIQNKQKLGTWFLSTVEKAKNKTQLVKDVYEDVLRNRVFYKHRNLEGHKYLVLNKKK